MEAIMEPQVNVHGVEQQEEVEEEEALIRKRKSKNESTNGKSSDSFPDVQVEVEKDEGVEDVAKPMVYFDEKEGKGDAIFDSHVPEDVTKHENQQGNVVLEISEMLHLQHSQQIAVASDRNAEPVSNVSNLEHDGMNFTTTTKPSGACEKSDATIDSQILSDTRKHNNQKGIVVLEESGILHVDQPHPVVVAAEKGDAIFDSHVPEDVTQHENQQGNMVLEKSDMLHVQQSQQIVVASDRNAEPVSNDSNLENDCMDFTTATKPSAAREDGFGKATEVHSLEQVSLSSDLGTLSRQSGKVLQEQSAPTLSKTGVLLQEDKYSLVISSEMTNATSVVPDERTSAMPVSSHETIVEIDPLIGNMPATNIISTSERLHPAAGGWDILKAIVYGGLAESIASLGVTSSAAGGDASTLSIVALGLANLIGGLFVLIHNIFELKGNTVQYTETIGQPWNFWRNTIVVAVSYILFGLVAPITYGFSFRESDNKDYKLMAVAIASLLCIIILALAKARVTDRFYIKKVIYFATLGVAVSGISYVVGIYIKKLLDQLGWISESQNTLYSPSFIMETIGRASQDWVSYTRT